MKNAVVIRLSMQQQISKLCGVILKQITLMVPKELGFGFILASALIAGACREEKLN